ncbi:MAG: beta-N-acetylhexosaminidase [Spirochaetota bacterium]
MNTRIKYFIFLILIIFTSCQTTRVHVPVPGPLREPREAKVIPNPAKGHMVEIREDPVARYMRSLTIEQKIGQRFIAHIMGTELTPETIHLIQDVYIGGLILYPWNVENMVQVKRLIDMIQQKAVENNLPLKLFICVDQEGGRVNAFRIKEVTRFPAPYYWAQYGDPYFVEAAAYITCREIASLGCNMNFAPVLDLYDNPDTTIIGDRSMGRDPSCVGMFGISYLRGAERAGVIAVFKHFPGHGSTTVDSHSRLPVVDIEESELLQKDFKPFRMVIENGAEAVMTAHVLFSSIDPDYPVTLSAKILRGMLRNQFGFQGVVVSDGLSMGALSYYYELNETLRLLFKSGVDLILVHSKYDIDELKSRVYDLYSEGEITKDEIDEGVERILRLKLKYGLLPR